MIVYSLPRMSTHRSVLTSVLFSRSIYVNDILIHCRIVSVAVGFQVYTDALMYVDNLVLVSIISICLSRHGSSLSAAELCQLGWRIRD